LGDDLRTKDGLRSGVGLEGWRHERFHESEARYWCTN
jgi:hypothetical protein